MSEQSSPKKQPDTTSSAALDHFKNNLQQSVEIKKIVQDTLREAEVRHLDAFRPMTNQWVKLCKTQQGTPARPRGKQRGAFPLFSAAVAHSPASLGASIRTRRKDLRLSQKQLADKAGVGPRFVSEVENGKDTAEIGRLLLVLDALDLELKVTRRG